VGGGIKASLLSWGIGGTIVPCETTRSLVKLAEVASNTRGRGNKNSKEWTIPVIPAEGGTKIVRYSAKKFSERYLPYSGGKTCPWGRKAAKGNRPKGVDLSRKLPGHHSGTEKKKSKYPPVRGVGDGGTKELAEREGGRSRESWRRGTTKVFPE